MASGLQSGTVKQTGGYNFAIKGKKEKTESMLPNQVHNSPFCSYLGAQNVNPALMTVSQFFSFSIILYELNSRRGPFGQSGLALKQVLRKVVRFGYVHEPIFRPPIDQLKNSFDFVRHCLEEAWSENPGNESEL